MSPSCMSCNANIAAVAEALSSSSVVVGAQLQSQSSPLQRKMLLSNPVPSLSLYFSLSLTHTHTHTHPHTHTHTHTHTQLSGPKSETLRQSGGQYWTQPLNMNMETFKDFEKKRGPSTSIHVFGLFFKEADPSSFSRLSFDFTSMRLEENSFLCGSTLTGLSVPCGGRNYIIFQESLL